MRNNFSSNFILFLIGLFSYTQVRVIGSIGISELFVFVIAPFLFIKNLAILRKDGFMTMINLSILAIFSCIISSVYNHSHVELLLRGVATCYSIFAFTVVFHHLLRDNLDGFKWVLVGICFSNFLNIFAFRRSVETFRTGVDASGDLQTEAITSGPLFWLGRLGPVFTLPARGWYFAVPTWISGLTALVMPIFTIATTSTGRSATAMGVATAAMILVGGKRITHMKRMQKHLVVVLIGMMILAVGIKQGYKTLAENGLLNEEATAKYQAQMNKSVSKKGLIGMLVGGRGEFFMGVYCGLNRPFWGYGPWAHDTDGLVGEYLYKYGDVEDYERYVQTIEYRRSVGRPTAKLLPAHSYIVGFWVYYGLLAVPVWIYILYLMYKLCRYNLCVAPQLYGFFCITFFDHMWNIFFSPYSTRVETPMFIVMILLVDAIRRNKIALPAKYYFELRNQKYR